jgi:hypothetical protein
MSERAVAATHYGDFKGTVSVDGYDGPFLWELRHLVRVPAGYMPVGFEVYDESPSKSTDSMIRLTVLAVDAEAMGDSIDTIAKRARESGRLPVFEFRGEVELMAFLKLVKQFHVVAIHKALKGIEATIIERG